MQREFKQIRQEEFGRNWRMGKLDKTEVGGSSKGEHVQCVIMKKTNTLNVV